MPKPKQQPPPHESSVPAPIPSSSHIHSLHQTLHLLYHHNKNQHRASKWFKWLDLLRRWAGKLARALERVERGEIHEDEDGDENEGEGGSSVRGMMRYLGREVVPRSYCAFSTVVADIQFSTLGVVLLAVLAQVADAVGGITRYISVPLEREGGIDTQGERHLAGEDVGEVVGRSEISSLLLAREKSGDTRVAEKKEDKVKVRDKDKKRRCVENFAEATVSAEPGVLDEDMRGAIKDKKKKKKRKKGNAIDNIFGGLT